MTVYSIESRSQFEEVTASNKFVLVDCYAQWCGPCRIISPQIENYSEEATWKDKVFFAKVDVDAQPEISEELGVRVMPTFFLFKDNQKVDSFSGANPTAIFEMLMKHTQ